MIKQLRRLGLKLIPKRFCGDDSGAAAVEFGIVVVPFLAILFAILETALVFFATQTLETAVADTSRLIFTGQAQQQGLSQATFKSQVCGKIVALFDCAGGISVDVKTYTSFSATNTTNPVTNGTLDKSSFGYQPGGPGDIVVMRLFYEWPIYVSLFNTGIANLNNNNRLIVATAAFRNEPYQ